MKETQEEEHGEPKPNLQEVILSKVNTVIFILVISLMSQCATCAKISLLEKDPEKVVVIGK